MESPYAATAMSTHGDCADSACISPPKVTRCGPHGRHALLLFADGSRPRIHARSENQRRHLLGGLSRPSAMPKSRRAGCGNQGVSRRRAASRRLSGERDEFTIRMSLVRKCSPVFRKPPAFSTAASGPRTTRENSAPYLNNRMTQSDDTARERRDSARRVTQRVAGFVFVVEAGAFTLSS